MKKYLIPINFFLSIVAAVLLFFSARVWFSQEKVGRVAKFQATTGEKTVNIQLEKGRQPEASYDVIEQRNLFRPERKAWSAPHAPRRHISRSSSLPPPASSIVTIIPTNLKLKGIISSAGDNDYVFFDKSFSAASAVFVFDNPPITASGAFVFDKVSGKTARIKKVGGSRTSELKGKRHFRLNDRIADYYTLSQIHENYVILKTDRGENVKLVLKLPKAVKIDRGEKTKSVKSAKPAKRLRRARSKRPKRLKRPARPARRPRSPIRPPKISGS